MTSPSEQTLLITGANSFVGGHIITEALSRGYNVRGTARSESSIAKAKDLFDSKYASQISFAAVSDITKPELYESAFAGTDKPITGVINVAAPFALKVEDNKRDLLDPAVAGALGIMEAVKRFGTHVQRIVTTSSFASIVDIGQGYRPGYTYTEKDWNPMGYDEAAKADGTTAYCASKALAEKALWDCMEREKPSCTLAAICPPWVFGPHIGGLSDLKHLNESTSLLWGLVGADKVPPVDFAGFADVRVVAAAHISAFEKPDAAGQRFLVGIHFDYQSAVDTLRDQMPELQSRLPVGQPGAGKMQEMYAMDGSKAERILGIKYISLEQSMKESMSELVAAEAA